MPKLKTHKGAKKRFRLTASGKVKRKQAGKRHLQSHKSGKRRQQLRGVVTEDDRMARKIAKFIGE